MTSRQKLVAKANRMVDPMSPFVAFQKFERNGLVLHLECKRVSHLPEATLSWAFELLKRNVRHMYEHCEWGWNEKAKKDEMTDEKAWYLIASASNDHPVAFSHFRFDIDYGVEVLYCYELQLEEVVRRKGLGKYMLQLLELIAASSHMKKVVLTVLKQNSQALTFFTTLGYMLDDTSPQEVIDGPHDYLILSKGTKRV